MALVPLVGRPAIVALCAALAACAGDPPPQPAPVPAPAAAAPSQAEALAPEVARLLAEGNAAFAESRFVSPPGNNAMERYLSALQLDPTHLGVKEAMTEIFPAVAAAAERAIEQGERKEAARIIALLQRASPDSLAVRALRERLATREAGGAPAAGGDPAQPAAAAEDPVGTPSGGR